MHLPEGANVPALGLSNKAVFHAEKSPESEESLKPGTYPENYFTPISLSGRVSFHTASFVSSLQEFIVFCKKKNDRI